MKRFLRRALVGFAWTLAALVALVILFYAEEDWRGARDWAACQKELQAKGETLDLRQLAPLGKPEDDLTNAPIFTGYTNRSPWFQQNEYSPHAPQIDSIYAGPIDLKAWQKFYQSVPEAHSPEKEGPPAQDILHVLAQFDDLLNRVAIVVNGPNAYWSLDYFQTIFGRLPRGETWLTHLTKVLALRGVAHLENNQSELAKDDFLLCLKFSKVISLDGSAFNLTTMARNDTITVLWEGLHRHSWSDAQLREMETALASTDMLALGVKFFQVKRAGLLLSLNMYQKPDARAWNAVHEMGNGDRQTLAVLRFSLWWPAGWWDHDRCLLAVRMQQMIEAIRPEEGQLQAKAFVQKKIETEYHSWKFPLGAVICSIQGGQGQTIAKAETNRRLERLACRLEEFRIAQGHYPEKLEELPDLPAHLNQEVLSEQPLRYQRKGEGYSLYSIGWNEKDDGGVIDGDSEKGDWVWPSP